VTVDILVVFIIFLLHMYCTIGQLYYAIQMADLLYYYFY